MLFSTGCGTELHELTAEEEQLIIHSAAYFVAKHNIQQKDGVNGYPLPDSFEEDESESESESQTENESENAGNGSGGGAGEAYLDDNSTTFPGFQGSDGGTRAGNGTKHDFSIVDEGGVVTTNFNYIAAQAPAANSGGGGGGGGIAAKNASYRQGTGGADGIVVIRYEYDSVVRGFVINIK
jgi:hypothetical protein